MSDFIEVVSDDFPEIFFIHGNRNARYPYSNSMLFKDILIDTGISNQYIRRLKKEHKITKVLLSHWHEDHISGNYRLKNSEFFCHKNDQKIIENTELMYEYYNIKDSPIEEQFQEGMSIFNLRDTKITDNFENDELIKIDEDLCLKVLHTPGHTAGHCSFLETNSKIAFLADIDLSSFPFYGGIDSDLIKLEKSLEKLLECNLEIVATGHKGIFRDKNKIQQAIMSYQDIIKKRDKRILDQLSERSPTKTEQLKKLNLIYKKYGMFEDYEHIAEMVMINKHFEKLLKEKRVIFEDGGYILS
ncbi:MAG: MBL fold metallo-hydrolase [Candidatus Lokiarchaeota archaeon]|nr:MBL fold metallo-hydrolase [Candidatus Lokiarchaeota archaeon]MBD3199134.1 MBL fold metallo-hydrolase [Candidatus Lokiarchaeota archaeon]